MTSDRVCWVKYMAVSDEGAVQNLFMLQRLIEMVKVRKDDRVVAMGNMEKAYYDRVNRKRLFEVMRGYEIHDTIVGLI